MTDDNGQSGTEADTGPSIFARLGSGLAHAASITGQIAAVLSLIVFVMVAGWATVEQLTFWRGDKHTQKTTERSFLCSKHAFTLPEDASDKDALQIVLQIYALKENARQHAIPFDTVGRIRHFLQCSVVTDVSTTSVSFKSVLETQSPLPIDTIALLKYERAHHEFALQSFGHMVPGIVLEIWGQRLNALEEKLEEEPPVALVASAPVLTPVAERVLQLGSTDNADLRGAWVLIVSSDADTEAALFEAGKLRDVLSQRHTVTGGGTPIETELTFAPPDGQTTADSVGFFSTGKRVRTVAIFPDRTAADAARTLLQNAGVIRLDAYTRSIGA